MEKEIKYLYIDDRKNGAQSVQNFPVKGELSITVVQPTATMGEIMGMIQGYDGVIVDQQLDEETIDDKFTSDYLGSSLAANIRVKENETKILHRVDISIPIVLFSANENVPLTLYGLGEEVFDLKIYKIDDDFESFKSVVPMYRTQIISLVRGYNVLKELEKNKTEKVKTNVCDSLQLGQKLNLIDSRFLDELKRRESLTAHSKASFILNELIIKQGILVDEEILAVRLGIDKNESKENWKAVLADLKKFGAEYQGVFCEGWPRWWMPMVDEWWYQLEGSETYIRFYSAEKRAKLIEEKLNEKLSEKIHLVPAKATSRYSVNTDYWTICDESKEPLDIEDGLMRPNQENLYPWQDAKYVCIQAALEGADVAEFEKERLKRI